MNPYLAFYIKGARLFGKKQDITAYSLCTLEE
jgi:hypothetical protein